MQYKKPPLPRSGAISLRRAAPVSLIRSNLPGPNYNSTRFVTLPPLISEKKQSLDLCEVRSQGNPIAEIPPMEKVEETPISDEVIPFSISNLSSSLLFKKENYFQTLPPLPPVLSSKFNSLFYAKIEQCKQICNFYDPKAELEHKAIKQADLEDIISLFQNQENINSFNQNHLQLLFDLISANLFRPLPVQPVILFVDDIPPIIEPAWPHLSLIYQILQRLIRYFDQVSFFSDEFISKLINLMRTPDTNEQAILIKVIKHFLKTHESKIPPMLTQLANMIDYSRNNLNKDESPFFIQAVLILMKWIFIFISNTNQQFIKVFLNCIIPLLHDSHLSEFYPQLKSIIEFFAEERPMLASKILIDLIKHWPQQIVSKQSIYLELMLYLFSKVPKKDIEANLHRIFSLYAECSNSYAIKVAEKAFNLWTLMECQPIIHNYSKMLIPIMYEPIFEAKRVHWSKTVRENASLALKLMNRYDPRILQMCSEEKPYMASPDGLKKWATIARQAARRDHSFNLGQKLSEISLLYNKKKKMDIFSNTSNSYRQRSNSLMNYNNYNNSSQFLRK